MKRAASLNHAKAAMFLFSRHWTMHSVGHLGDLASPFRHQPPIASHMRFRATVVDRERAATWLLSATREIVSHLAQSQDPSEGEEMKTLLLLVPCAVAGIVENAYATDSEPTSAAALIREWKSLEAICRGSGDPAACEKLNSVGQELGQTGWCFNGYGSGRRWIKC